MFLSYWNMFKIDFPTILHFHNLLKLNSKHAPVLLNTLNKINSLQFFTCFFWWFFFFIIKFDFCCCFELPCQILHVCCVLFVYLTIEFYTFALFCPSKNLIVWFHNYLNSVNISVFLYSSLLQILPFFNT